MIRKAALILTMAAVTAACDENPMDTSPVGQVATVSVAPGDTALVVGQSGQMRVTIRASDGSVLEGTSVVWQSSDPTVAEVSTTGIVRGVTAGAVRLRASVGGRTGEARVSVEAPQVVRVDVDRGTLDLVEGDEVQLTATPRDGQGAPITGLGVQWSSSSPEVAAVDALGRVTAVRDGTAAITVRVHGKSATVPVTVTSGHAFDLVYTVRAAEGIDELFRLSMRGSGPTPERLVSLTPWSEQPRLSPDGSRVAFECMDTFGDRSICVADRDGGNRTLVADQGVAEGYMQPAWNHDGTRLAFVHHLYASPGEPARSRIGVVDADGTHLTIVTADMPDGQYEPAWSPVLADGSERIVFSSGTNSVRSLWTMKPDGSDRRRVTTGPDLFDAAPDWSPDGQTLVFQRVGAAGFDLRLVDAQGGNDRSLGLPRTGNQVAPAWSPDGRLVAFLSNHETPGIGAPSYQIYTVWADGSKLARRTGDDVQKVGPAWLRR